MGQSNLQAFLDSLSVAFLSGRLEDVRSKMTLPLVVYSVAGVTVLRTEEDFQRTMDLYRAALIALAVERSEISIVECDMNLNKRLRVTVRTRDLDTLGREVTSSLIRYFLVEAGESYRVEMMEYLEAPVPPDEVERIVH